MQDTDQAVGHLAQRRLVANTASALTVVVAARPGTANQRPLGLPVQGIDQAIVVHKPGLHALLHAGLAGDRTGPRIVLASFRVGVAGAEVVTGKFPADMKLGRFLAW